MNNHNIKPCLQAVNYNQNTLEELKFALEMSQGQFSLILAKCNYGILRDCIREELQELCPDIPKIDLQSNVTKLYSEIRELQGEQQLPGLVIYGLESVQNIEQLLLSLNPVREEFRKNCHFAVVLWINDDIIRLFKRLIPDFESWTTRIVFTIPADILIRQLQLNSHVLFERILELGANSKFIPNEKLFTPDERLEILAALRDLENEEQELDLALQASIEFAQGRRLNRKHEIDTALSHYQKSLELWQQLAKIILSQQDEAITELQEIQLKEAIVLFYIGLCHNRKAEIFYTETRLHWQEAKKYFEECLNIFERQNKLDLVAKFIFHLQKNLEQLEACDELQQLSQKAETLHKTYQMQLELAQDYAFLAEVALSKHDAVQGKKLIEQAFSILDADTTEQERGWYWFILAKAQRQLKQINEAVTSLKNAQQTDLYRHPKLYLAILQELHDIYYFEQHDYLKAFELKEEQRYVKTQLGITAFVGAGRLQTSIRAKYQQRKNDKQEQIPQEIAASGRQNDIEQLTARIGSTQHKLTVIHGQSGVGKSSLVNAGLVPFLQCKSIGTLDVLPIVLRVYTNWIKELGNSCQQALSEKDIPISLTLDSTLNIIEQLQRNAHHNLLTVLVFDQFEEFFFVCNDPIKRKEFFDFLSQLLNIPVVKVILSLREDYLHYLLICNRMENMKAINNDILNKNILYPLGNFSSENAKEVIKRLSEGSQFQLEPELIEYIVQELSNNLGEVRPIEMQVIGAQMQTEGITTLAKYQALGTKETLVQHYLASVIQDCGVENQELAEDVLYLLTDENNTRPLKTREELETELKTLILDLVFTEKQLKLVLEIFVKSGLVFLIPEQPENRYQIVHDYLVAFIRQQRGDDLSTQLKEEREKRKKSEAELNQVLKRQLKIVSAGVVVTAIWAILAVLFGVEANIGQVNAELREMSAKSETLYASGRKLDALVEGIKAGKKLQDRWWQSRIDKDTYNQVIARLQETVYGLTTSNQLEGHKKPVTDAAFSPNDEMIASASEDKTIKIWKSDGQLIKTLEGHKEEVYAITFSPDSKLLASASKDGKIKLWKIDGKNSKEIPIKFAGHSDRINDISFSPDGKLIATASSDGTVKLWTLDGKLFKNLKGHKSNVTLVIFSPNGKLVATASTDETIKLWDLTTGRQLQSFDNRGVKSMTFSPDSQMLMMVFTYNWQRQTNQEGSLEFWSLDGRLIKITNTQFPFYNYMMSANFSSDGQRLFIVDTSDGIQAQLLKITGTRIELIAQDIQLSDISENSNLILNHKGEKVIAINYGIDNNDNNKVIFKNNVVTLQNLDREGFQTQDDKQEIDNILDLNQDDLLISVKDNLIKLWKFDGILAKSPIKVSDDISQLKFSLDGSMIASVSSDNTGKVLNQNGYLIKNFNEDISLFSVSPDGKLSISVGWDNIATLWKSDGTEIKKLQGHQDIITDIFFSPNSQIIATISRDHTVKLWTAQGTEIKTLQGHKDGIKNVIFSPDSQLIATVGWDNQIKLWDEKGQLIKNIQGYNDHNGERHDIKEGQIKFSSNSQFLFVPNDNNNNAQIWDRNGKNILNLNSNNKNQISQIFFISNNQEIITIDKRGKKIIIWNLQGTISKIINLENMILFFSEIILTPDNQLLIYTDENGLLNFVKLDGTIRKTATRYCNNYSQLDYLSCFHFSADSQTIAKIEDNNVEFWDKNGEKIETEAIKSYGDNPPAIVVNSISKTNPSIFDRIASVDKNNIIKLWDSQGKEVAQLKGHQKAITQVSFSPDGKTLVSVDKNKIVKLWSSSDGKLIKSFPKHEYRVNSVAISGDNQSITIWGDDDVIKVWDSQGKLLTKLKGHRDAINSFNFSPNNKMIAAGSYNEDSKENTIILWNLTDGKKIRDFKGHTEKINSISFSIDSKIIATASDDNTIKLWNLDGKEITTLKGHSAAVNQVIFSPDGQTIATASDDSTIRLWNLDGTEKATLKGHSSGVTNINFSPNSQMIVSSDSNDTKLWSVDGKLLKSFDTTTLNGSELVKFTSDGQQIIAIGSEFNYIMRNWERKVTIWSWNLDELLKKGCDEVRDYLKTNPNVEDEDRDLCS